MNEDFDEQLVNDIIDQALSLKPDLVNPFATNYLGLAETDLLSEIHNKFSKRIPEYEVNEIIQDVRTHILSRKISTSLKDLHTVTLNCRKCNISSQSDLPKWNVVDPDILIIAESPSFSSEAVDLLIAACKQASINSNTICLTYVNRCPVKRQYEPQEITNCSSYLHQEIQILNPKIIITLGSIPSSVIFGTSIKIKDYRGSVHWLGYWPIITTYSLYYALKSGQTSIDHLYSDFRQATAFLTKKDKASHAN